VAALLPMFVAIAVLRRIPASKLLMPLAGSAGAQLLLIGRPVNVIVSDAAAEAGVGAFGFTEFAHVGLPLVAGTVLFVLTAVFGQLISNSVFGVIRPGGCSHRRWAADSA
jgi:hypothetical protein